MVDKDRALQRKQTDFEKHDRNLEEMGIRELFQSPGGKRFFWWLLTITGWGHQPFSANALNTAFKCGELNIGQQLMVRVGAIDPVLIANLMTEIGKENDGRSKILGNIERANPDGPALETGGGDTED